MGIGMLRVLVIHARVFWISECGCTHSWMLLQNNNNNNTIWRGSVLTGEEPPPHSGELKHALSQAGGPTQSQLSRPMSSGHRISMEHRLRRKQLHSDTDPAIKNIWKKYKKKEKKKLFPLKKWKKWKTFKNQKMKKWTKNDKKWKLKSKTKDKKREKKKVTKKGKEGPKGYHPRWAQKLIFHIRTVKRNRNEIEAQKKIKFWAPNKDRQWKKTKENERKWKKMKENERKWKKMKEHERKWKKIKENEGK